MNAGSRVEKPSCPPPRLVRNQATIKSGVQDISLKEDLQYYPDRNNILHLGFNMIYHTFIPGQVTAISSVNSLVNLNVQKTHSLENAVYASNEENFAPWFKMIYGVRLSLFTCLGPQTVYTNYITDPDNGATYPLDSTSYKTAQPIVTYWNLEPRLSMSFIINETTPSRCRLTGIRSTCTSWLIQLPPILPIYGYLPANW